MELVRCQDSNELGRQAAAAGAAQLRQALAQKGSANIIVATGASQFATLAALLQETEIHWSRVVAFHLDEYIGLSATHPASFRKFLHERFVDLIPLKAFHDVQADAADPYAECARLGELISCESIDVAFIGIGENGHLAFNDPPADFETETPYLVVNLDEACRKQQLGEGWFPTLADVPKQAISMSVRQILKSQHLICSVPDARKSTAVRNSVQGPVTSDVPASILQQHPQAVIFVDPPAAQELTLSE
ncbi:glucosamine-6-phosphate deaminase [Planctomicrobium piriforme]|uniref:Glucosamine-6-phosphate deaminase n=1 Tax=Planctomicrobium piriforme TaxID=1576369 RepID=A0A1I3QDQ2_9PLAN|nr:glucosamine-6-phosphate deaminase [Planctomicrobium piriforme]SFJ31709.1 glucosamine-6-phosphate deaminase [Planctomicrobium piriforme]